MITLLQPLHGLCRRARRFLDPRRGATRPEPVPFPRKALFEVLEQRLLLSATVPGVAEATDAVDADAVTAAVNDLLAFEAPAAPAVNLTPPVAVDDLFVTTVGTPVSGNILANDIDPDSAVLFAVQQFSTASGGLVLNNNGSFTYTPYRGFIGTDSFRYFATDGDFMSLGPAAVVTFTVTPPNKAPIAVDDFFTINEDTVASGNVLTNDTDVDGDHLTAVLVAGTANGQVVLNRDGSFTYTPALNLNGPDSFTYRANDGQADSAVATVTIGVTPVNDAPVAVADTFATDEDKAVSGNVLANDTDVDNVSLTAVLVSGPANGQVVLNTDGSFTYTPALNFNGNDSFTYRANDGQADSADAKVTINIAPVNDAPIAVDDVFVTAEDTSVSGNVLANDIDVEKAVLSAVQQVGTRFGRLTLNTDGSFTYIPDPNFNGTDSFSYIATDGNLRSPQTAVVTFTVTPVNDAPVAVADTFATDEDTVVSGNVLTNDTDVDRQDLTAVLVTGPAKGEVVLNPDGSFTYTPALNFNGPDSFTYRANDGQADSAVAEVTINVAPVNDAPVAVADTFATDEDKAVSGNVLANDTDVDNVSLTAVLVSGPVKGEVVLNPDGSFTYTPTLDFNGPDSFTYRANDGQVNSAVAKVTIDVTPVNDAPVAVDDAFVTNEDTVSGNVLANDTDVDNVRLTAVLVAGPRNGAVALNPDGSFTYTPALNFNGSDSFTYRANDGQADSAVATVTIGVTPVNDAPVAVADTFATDQDKAVTGNVLANDTDVDNVRLTAVLVSGPANGQVVLNPDGSFTYTPALNFNGSDSFTYRANDGRADSAPATVSLTVNPLNNHAPIFTTVPVTEFILKAPGASGDSVFRVAGTPGQSVSVQLDWLEREAAYNNEVGIYRVADLDGRVNGIAPGEAGYARAALGSGNSTVIFASGKGAGAATTLTLRAGDLYGFYLIQNDTTSHFLSANPENRTGCGPLAFFSVAVANPDRYDHLHGAFQADGSVKLAWEDLTSGGDKDFNDLVIRATTLALPEGAGYVYRSHADDVDGDALTYSLVEGPQGAKVDARTGEVTWQPIAPGTYRFVLRAEDGHAGAAEQAFDLVVRRAERALYVRGTEQSDHIEIFEHDGAVQVRVNGDTHTYFGVSVIHVESFGGSDRIELAGVTVRTLVDAGAGNDEIDAGDVIVVGIDLWGGLGNDEIEGGRGADRIDGGGGSDEIEGGDGADLIDGGSGSDEIEGGNGADWIDGGSGSDELDGGRGDDVLLGGTGDDLLIGGRGDDLLVGGAGRDWLDGGPGNDVTIAAGLLAGPTPPTGIAPLVDWGAIAQLGRLSDRSAGGERPQTSWVTDFVTTLGQSVTELNPNAGIMIVVDPAPR